MAIPKEYLDSEFDFGFSTSDDESTPVQSSPTVTSQDISEPIVEKLNTLEAMLTDMAKLLEG
jgi:hypothetical protein